MAFNVSLYNQSNDKRVVSKTLGTAIFTTSAAVARDAFDVRNGQITIATSTDITKCNYCYISDLGRYYYITDIEILRNDVYVLTLRCDVLMTFAAGIRSLSGTVDRQQSKYNGYIPDGDYKQLAYSKIVAKSFPNGMTADNLILLTVG